MMSKTSQIVLGLLLSSGSVLGRGKKGGKSSGKGSGNERMECGSHTRDIDGGRYAYYRYDDELYVEARTDFFTNLTQPWESKQDLDPACTKGIFHNMGFLAFNPMGHPSLDFYGGGYGVPHWDMHFFNPSVADTEAGGDVDVSSCAVTGPVPVLCDQNSADPRNIKFDMLPPAEEITGFYKDVNWGGHSVSGHGMHLLDERGLLPGGPLDITLDNNGITSPVGPFPPFAVCFMQADGVDRGCRVGTWDGLDPVINTYNGKIIAQEPMFTNSLISTMAGYIPASSQLEVRVQKSFPTPEKQSSKKAMATDVFVAVSKNDDGDKVAQVGLVLGSNKFGGKKGKHAKLSMEVTPGMQMFAVSGGIALLVVGTALMAFRSMRKANTEFAGDGPDHIDVNHEDEYALIPQGNIEDSACTESTPLSVTV